MSTPSVPAGTAAQPVRPSVRRPRRGWSVVAASAVAGAVLLAGCSQQSGTAATADGRRITVDEVQQGTADLLPYYSGIDQRTVLVLLAGAPAVLSIAEEAGVGVSADDARASLEKTATANGAKKAPTFGHAAVEVMRFSLAQKALQGATNATELVAEENARLAKISLDVNPRYGKVDLATGTVTDITYPWLVAPSDASTAAAK